MSLSEEERNTIVALEIEKAKNTFAEVIGQQSNVTNQNHEYENH